MSGDTYAFQSPSIKKNPLPNAPDICLLTNLHDKSNAVVGVDIQKFFSNVEKKGRKAEQLFKQCIDKHDIPSLYIGQGLNGIEQLVLSGNDDKVKRPDFLVALPNFGHVFFDVKCRKKLGFKNDKNRWFYLDEIDFERLYNLQLKLMMPVWVAFGDADAVYKNKAEFYVAPIKILHNYYQALVEKIGNNIRATIAHFFIPNELLCPMTEDNFSIRLISESFISSIVKYYADLHHRRIRFIFEEVYPLIKHNSLLKKDAVKRLFDSHKDNTTYKEWDHFIKTDPQIKYEPYCALQLR
jgi:hypothetical protein